MWFTPVKSENYVICVREFTQVQWQPLRKCFSEFETKLNTVHMFAGLRTVRTMGSSNVCERVDERVTANPSLYLSWHNITSRNQVHHFRRLRVPHLNNQNVVVCVHMFKAYGRAEVYLHSYLTSTLVGGEQSASRLGRLNHSESAFRQSGSFEEH